MTTLIIPDIHLNHKCAQCIIDGTSWDELVCLGDYFDNWEDTPEDAEATAVWLANLVREPNVTCLFGNHDLPYAFGATRWTQCSGYTSQKQDAIATACINWKDLQFYTYVDGWLLTHAGVNKHLLATLATDAVTLRQALASGANHPWLAVSKLRGGYGWESGPFWQDWREAQVTPKQDQIVGHTPHMETKEKIASLNRIVDLDTQLRNYALVVGGELQIRKTPELWR